MLNKISRYYHTLKHLKPIQIRYQVWYRLRAKFLPVQYAAIEHVPTIQKIQLERFPKQHTHYIGENHFQFLNLDQKFISKIDWNYIEYGKLWAYHLNYFDYLHQAEMSWETGKYLIDDFLENPSSRSEGLDPYPISLRVINWIKFLSINQKFPDEIVKSIYAQFDVLKRKVEYHLLGNHLFENGFALLFGAVFFQDKELTKLANKILSKELKEQILGDGGHFELSPMYHVILLQRALDGYNLLKNNKHDLHDLEIQLTESIKQMVNWLNTITFSNGDIPMLNDSVDGQALKATDILLYAKQLGFTAGLVKLDESGYRKFKTGEIELMADVGEVGPSYQPGHAHSDTLNFVLYYKGEPIIVDRGISTYEKNQLRDEERGTASHNTVMVNNEEQTDVWGGFRVGKRAMPVVITDETDHLKASHTGYENLGINHIREWTIHETRVVITDEIKGKESKATAFFHFNPMVKIEQQNENEFIMNKSLKMSIFEASKIDMKKYNCALGFNKVKEGVRLVCAFNHELKVIINRI